jgi:uncharacterized protein (TIGR02145 family)
MKLILTIIFVLTIFTNRAFAQESIYLYKDGAVVGEFEIANIDSITFYRQVHGTVEDIEGNEYNTVVIGTQNWMAESLRTTTYDDETSIPIVTDKIIWQNITVGACCWNNNDPDSYKETYGALYNWKVIESNKICPSGWHVPTVTEWNTLIEYLGGKDIAGGKLKMTNLWLDPNSGASNESGLSVKPSGYRHEGEFGGISESAVFWSSSINYDAPYYFTLDYERENIIEIDLSTIVADGFSVRCIED